MFYFVKQPWWLKKILPGAVWEISTTAPRAYLTFDDGPVPSSTPRLLEQLRVQGIKATFFCRGDRVAAHPGLYQQILEEGHAVGNHSWSHLDGWRVPADRYIADVRRAQEVIQSDLFRPPYGRITPRLVRRLKEELGLTTVMWSITAGDFDPRLSPEKVQKNIDDNLYPGAIVLLHDGGGDI